LQWYSDNSLIGNGVAFNLSKFSEYLCLSILSMSHVECGRYFLEEACVLLKRDTAGVITVFQVVKSEDSRCTCTMVRYYLTTRACTCFLQVGGFYSACLC
jgi:hypothetical protein